MVKARITVFDDETGETICRDRVIAPSREEHGTRMGIDGPPIDEYYFTFVLKRIAEIRAEMENGEVTDDNSGDA